jgi:diacylglycerol kinase (ATP)
MRVAFIVNPIAGPHKAGKRLGKVLPTWSSKLGFVGKVFITEYAGHALSLTNQAIEEGFTHVVAVGGDGTVREVGMSLLGKNSTLGIVPIGSGNGIARHLGIPTLPKKAVEVIATLDKGLIDVGWVNDHPFFMVFGLGFDADVAATFASLPNRGLGDYMRAGWDAFTRRVPFQLTVSQSGSSITYTALMATTANGSQFGNNAYIAPEASMQDGALNLTIIDNVNMLDALQLVGALFTKQIGKLPTVTQNMVYDATYKSDTPIAFHLDGEPMGKEKEFLLRVQPKVLSVLCNTSGI